MPIDHRAKLATIKTFPQLIAYLRDEMGWPLANGNDFEDLTFEYTAEELGIDAKNAAKIQEIKRLRPLSTHQPWGIFFVKFEPKKLPVVALRRILSQVALKKRASANSAERAAWAADDLLFVSNYGEGEERQISFAHFSQSQDSHDLPTLKVLGWDNRDTALHLDVVARELTEHLAWPDDDANAEAWRTRWRAAFTMRHGEVVTTSKELSIRLAELARNIRDRIKSALAIETDRGPLTKLMKAFQTSLVHDLDADGFADMYAQTIAYGLLSARIADPHKKTADDFAAHMRTNPFLRELMETFLKVGGRRGKAGGPGIDFDELGVSEVVQLLDDANMEAVVRDFGDRNPQEDPVIHFYELFLKEYDAKKRMQRGVFYTPRPVVSYIVRSVDELLRTEFGLADGLADTTSWGWMGKLHKDLKIPEGVSPDQDFVQILDPATGTGTFLVEVIDLIHKTLVAKWKAKGHSEKEIDALWNEYVPKHLLTRLHGYELLMAPYAIAHLKIGLKLYETGYRFGSEVRARIYLTNALEPSVKQLPLIGFDALAHEASAVNEIKRHMRFTVVIGNPPYSNFGQLNKIPFILNLLEDYKRGLDEKKINIDDDFIKFIRFAHWTLARTDIGCLGFITNNTYLDGVTHRQMRKRVLDDFQTVRFVNLHGDSRKGEVTPDGRPDENVFDIQQGVAIGLFVRSANCDTYSVSYLDMWGRRGEKYLRLAVQKPTAEPWTILRPEQPYFFAVPKDFAGNDEYETFVPITEVLIEQNTGVQTKRDELFIDMDKHELEARFKDIAKHSRDQAYLKRTYSLEDSSGWSISKLAGLVFREQAIVRVLYRPFDIRWLYFDARALGRARESTMRHMIAGKNIGLITLRINGEGKNFVCLATRHVIEKGSLPRGNYSLFPLLLFDDESKNRQLGLGESTRANFGEAFSRKLNSQFSRHDLMPEDIFEYAYAVFHSPGYRSRYAEFLKIDFPSLPLTGNLDLFRALACLGGELTALHLLESPKLDHFVTTYTGPKNPQVWQVGWSDDTVWLDAAATKKGQPATPGTIGFRGVPEAVWNFHIGGYQVCEKWLKDRKGRTLSKDDIAHYQKIVVALNETIRLMQEIDVVIEQHGGWPGAFQTGEAQAAASKVIPFRPRIVQPGPKERYVTCVPLVPLKAAAGAFSDPQHIDDDGFEWAAIETQRRLRTGMFVAQVVGKSMEPAIPDGAYCLFAAPVEGTRQGKTVLVQLRDATDSESGERYTVKRYESEKAQDGDLWRHTTITLKPINPDFEPIVLTDADEGGLAVIAELVEVLGTG
ncbi:MAG: type ISP restriction/modification enzyme [Gemmatimonadales bacterium]|nr:type ISP restriction/modification enzyme [Gemmatimonadales bacterium]MDZ4390220.1 type ISP restriction/modification enzyme [Gemmatimonadales bacterium]